MYTNGQFEIALSLAPSPLWLIVTLHRKHRVGANLLGLQEFMEIQFAPNSGAAAALSTHGHIFLLHMGSGAKTFTSLQIGAEEDSKDPCMEDDSDGKD